MKDASFSKKLCPPDESTKLMAQETIDIMG